MNLDDFPTSKNMQQCACCDYFSLAERGKCLICPVCFWEDDCENPNNPKWDSPSDLNDDLTLKEARSNFKKFGAWNEKFSKIVINGLERNTLKLEPRIV